MLEKCYHYQIGKPILGIIKTTSQLCWYSRLFDRLLWRCLKISQIYPNVSSSGQGTTVSLLPIVNNIWTFAEANVLAPSEIMRNWTDEEIFWMDHGSVEPAILAVKDIRAGTNRIRKHVRFFMNTAFCWCRRIVITSCFNFFLFLLKKLYLIVD